MQGKIEEIEEKEFQDKPYLRARIDGNWYSVWNRIDIFKSFGIGKEIGFEIEEKGKFKNIVSFYDISKKSVENLSVKDLNIESYRKGCNDTINKIIKKLKEMKE